MQRSDAETNASEGWRRAIGVGDRGQNNITVIQANLKEESPFIEPDLNNLIESGQDEADAHAYVVTPS